MQVRLLNTLAMVLIYQYIPEGDDPFEPIYASQIQCVLDVTENEANMPDFTAMDDRKYWVKVVRGSSLLWQEWALSGEVQFNFSTGIRLQFNAVCGLGMLADIRHIPPLILITGRLFGSLYLTH